MCLEIPPLEIVGVMRLAVRIETVFDAEWVERRIDFLREGFVLDRGIQTAQPIDGNSRVRVHENDAVGFGQPGEVVAALHELVWPFTVRSPFFRNGLIEA